MKIIKLLEKKKEINIENEYLSSLNSRKVQLEQGIEELKKQSNKSKKSKNYASDLQAKENELEELKKEITEKETYVSNLTNDMEELKLSKKAWLEKKISETEDKIKEYGQKADELKKILSDKESQLDRVIDGKENKPLDEAENELVIARTNFNAIKASFDSISEEYDELQLQLERYNNISLIVRFMIVLALVIIVFFVIVSKCCSHPTAKDTPYISETQTPAISTVAEQSEKATEKATEDVTEKLTEKPTEEATETPTEEVTEKPTEKIHTSVGSFNSEAGVVNKPVIEQSNNTGNASDGLQTNQNNVTTEEVKPDIDTSKDSIKDDGIIGGNSGYGATISGETESPVPEEIFEEENPLPPPVSPEDFPIIQLTPAN